MHVPTLIYTHKLFSVIKNFLNLRKISGVHSGFEMKSKAEGGASDNIRLCESYQ